MSEKRHRSRHSASGKVGLVWMDGAGYHHRDSGTWSDLSDLGGALLLNQPIQPGTTVRLTSPLLSESATAIVRQCLSKGMGYRLGLEALGHRWRRADPATPNA
jgi:hypothetical protein